METIKSMRKFFVKISIFLVIAVLVAACGPADDDEVENTPQPTIAVQNDVNETVPDNGYPGISSADSGYPGAGAAANDSGYPSAGSNEELLDAPPDIEVDIPVPQSGSSAVGGILVQEFVGEGYLPFDPYELILAEMILNNKGEPALIGFDEQSPRAETFQTGVFLFTNVPPGTYGLVVNTAVSQFPLKDVNGNDLLIELEDGEVLDMGQVFVQSP